MNAGFITFTDAKYAPLADVLIEGLLRHSKHSIEVCGMGMDYKFDSPRVRSYRIEQRKDDNYWPFSAKIRAALQTKFDAAAMLDADNVPNINVDQLVEKAVELKDNPYPLCSAHPIDPKNQGELMQLYGVTERSMDYVQANFLFGTAALPFFEECLAMMARARTANVHPRNFDETVINVNLWRMGAKLQLYPFIPYARYYLHPSKLRGYYGEKRPTFQTLHGEKDLSLARKLSEQVALQDRVAFESDPVLSRPPQIYENLAGNP